MRPNTASRYLSIAHPIATITCLLMWTFGALSKQGWRRTGAVNILLAIAWASLAVSGTSSPVQMDFDGDLAYLPGLNHLASTGFGTFIGSNYTHGKDIVQQTNATINATTIANIAGRCINWVDLSPQQCMDEFRPYRFRAVFKDVVLIVNAREPGAHGWKRDQVFELDNYDLGRGMSSAEYWDPRVPLDKVNSLWFVARCILHDRPQTNKTLDYVKGSELPGANDTTKAFDHSCGRLFGLNTSQPLYKAADIPDVTSLSFENDGLGPNATRKHEVFRGYKARPGARDLQIDHCLAEPAICQVRMSNILILTVIICVLIKIVTCVFLLSTLSETSIVTPGDAIESFISKPDLITKGLGTLVLSEAQDLECQPRKLCIPSADPEVSLAIRPRRWKKKNLRLNATVSRGTWVQSYYPIFLALECFGESGAHNVWQLDDLKMGYLGTLIFVNMPQLILSALYLTINSLFTQFHVEQEWNSYSRKHRPLRVSYPIGKQTSTYRLQLPYKYSISLIAVSILLHWLVSNAMFLFIIEGGAKGTGLDDVSPRPDLAESMGVSSDAVIAVGYSGLSILICFCVGIFVATCPIIFGCRKLKSDMVVGATNSLVISAACHVPRISSAAVSRDINDEVVEIGSSLVSGRSDEDGNSNKNYLAQVARGNVRWGAMLLPPDLAEEIEVHNEPVMHLGFGTEEHDIQAPQAGVLYA
ncbi:hypothetical protein G7054_g11020 [Neopestalotiopsis clavispora]|nr:hypothetical protein G7054_g11020 [Neopestalotiopsis clavispora]